MCRILGGSCVILKSPIKDILKAASFVPVQRSRWPCCELHPHQTLLYHSWVILSWCCADA